MQGTTIRVTDVLWDSLFLGGPCGLIDHGADSGSTGTWGLESREATQLMGLWVGFNSGCLHVTNLREWLQPTLPNRHPKPNDPLTKKLTVQGLSTQNQFNASKPV